MQYRRRPQDQSVLPSLLLLLEHSHGHRLVRDLCTGLLASGLFPCNPSASGNRQTVAIQRGVRSRGQTWSTPSPSAHPGAPSTLAQLTAPPPPLPSCSGQTSRVTAANASCLFSSPLCLPFTPPGWGFLLGFATQNSTLLLARLGAPGGARRRPGEAGSALQMTLGPPGRLSSRQGAGRAVGGAVENAWCGCPRDPCHPRCAPG